MDALDGNAIAGLLMEVFGEDMTTTIGVCGNCGARGPVAETTVYMRAPGVVVRCRSCTAILMVFSRVREVTTVDLLGLRSLEAT